MLVHGVPFFGYHNEPRPFIKIFLSNPSLVTRASAALSSGAVLGVQLQPCEAHIPFMLQFGIDYNVSGMDYLHCSTVYVSYVTDV